LSSDCPELLELSFTALTDAVFPSPSAPLFRKPYAVPFFLGSFQQLPLLFLLLRLDAPLQGPQLPSLYTNPSSFPCIVQSAQRVTSFFSLHAVLPPSSTPFFSFTYGTTLLLPQDRSDTRKNHLYPLPALRSSFRPMAFSLCLDRPPLYYL